MGRPLPPPVTQETLAELIEALRGAQTLIDCALPKFQWDRSQLDAPAVEALRTVPAQIRAALRKVGY